MEEAWKRQRQFAADASHELKTPLTVILSNVGLIAASPELTDPEDKRRIGYIQAERRKTALSLSFKDTRVMNRQNLI